MAKVYNPATGQLEEDPNDQRSLQSLAMNSPLARQPDLSGFNAQMLGTGPAPAAPSPRPVQGSSVDAVSAPTGLAGVNQALPTPDINGLNAVKTQQDISTTTRRTKISQGERDAQGDVESQIKEQGELARQHAQLVADQAEQVARAEDEAALRKSEMAQQRSAVIDAGEQEYKARQAKADEAYDKWAKTDLKALAPNAASIIGVALGAFASAGGGGPNQALAILKDKMDRDMEVQKANLAKQLQVADRWGSRAEGARELLRDQLKMLDIKQAATEDVVASRIRASAARAKVPEAKLAGEQEAARFAQSAAERRAKFLEGERTEVQSTVQKRLIEANPAYSLGGAALKLNGEQAKAADFAGRMIQDMGTIDKLPPMSEEGRKKLRSLAAQESVYEKNPTLKAAAQAAGLYKAPEEVLSDHDRQVFAAQKRIAASTLRGDSGAAISLGEYASFDQQYFPSPGDKDSDVQSKRQARQKLLDGMLIKAGPAAPLVQQQAQRPQGVAVPQQGPREVMINVGGQKKRARLHPDGSAELLE